MTNEPEPKGRLGRAWDVTVREATSPQPKLKSKLHFGKAAWAIFGVGAATVGVATGHDIVSVGGGIALGKAATDLYKGWREQRKISFVENAKLAGGKDSLTRDSFLEGEAEEGYRVAAGMSSEEAVDYRKGVSSAVMIKELDAPAPNVSGWSEAELSGFKWGNSIGAMRGIKHLKAYEAGVVRLVEERMIGRSQASSRTGSAGSLGSSEVERLRSDLLGLAKKARATAEGLGSTKYGIELGIAVADETLHDLGHGETDVISKLQHAVKAVEDAIAAIQVAAAESEDVANGL